MAIMQRMGIFGGFMRPFLMIGAGLILIFIFNLLLAKYVHRDAIRRHHPHAEFWAIVTLFFSVLGLLVYAVLRGDYDLLAEKSRTTIDRSPAAIEKARELVTFRKEPQFCPSCGEQAKPGANFCFKCGTALR